MSWDENVCTLVNAITRVRSVIIIHIMVTIKHKIAIKTFRITHNAHILVTYANNDT